MAKNFLGGIAEVGKVLGAILVIAGAAIYVGGKISDGLSSWRDAEYQKLSSLRAGYNLRYFEAQLGPPLASQVKAGLREDAFRGRDYWVQTVSKQGTVELYAVTSCSSSFQPTFLPAGIGPAITLNRDKLGDIVPVPDRSVGFDYLLGASAPSLFYEGVYGGTSAFYKTIVWGVNGICADSFKGERVLSLPSLSRTGFTAELGRRGLAFRRKIRINTFAETAPLVDGGIPRNFGIIRTGPRIGPVDLRDFGPFYVGPDRVLIQGDA